MLSSSPASRAAYFVSSERAAMVLARRTSSWLMPRSRAGEAVAAFVAMAAAVFPPAFILRDLRRFADLSSSSRCEFARTPRHLFAPQQARQFRPVKVLADGPHPRLDIVVEVDDADEDALDAEQLQRFDAMSAGDKDEVAVAVDDNWRALQADRRNRTWRGPGRQSRCRALIRWDFELLSAGASGPWRVG